MIDTIATTIYFTILFTLSFLCILQRKLLTKADRWIALWLLVTLISELSSSYAIHEFKNDMPIFHIWSPIELFLLSMYFNESVDFFKNYRVGKIVGIIGFMIALVNVLFLQPINTINSIFLLFEGFIIICYCLFSYYFLVLKEQEIIHNTHFWFTTILLVYWSSVFVYWGIFSFLTTSLKQYMDDAIYSLWIINILTYSGIGIVFIYYRKMISYHE